MSQVHPFVHPIPPVLAEARAIAEFLWIIKLVTHVFSVYAGNLLIAELKGSIVHYVHTDLLGSPISGVELPESKQRGRRARGNRRGQAKLANTPHGFFDGIEELGEVETDD